MAINFPASPTDGQTYTENGVKWKYNSAYTAWLVVDTPILANTSSGQVLYNYNDTIVSSNGISFSTGANTLYVNGMNVSSTLIVDGNVGIGTSSPGQKLHIKGVSGGVRIEGDGGAWDLHADNSTLFRIFDPSNTARIAINNVGVGIGTTSPSGTLDVRGGGNYYFGNVSNPRFRLVNTSGTASTLLSGADSGGVWLGAETNSFLYFITNSAERMRITSAGNVGIGTSSPATKLQISGTTDTIQFQTDYAGTTGIPAGALIRTAGNSSLTFIADASSGTAGKGVTISAYSGGAWFRGLDYSNRSGTPNLVLQQDGGNVGIGTSSPATKFHVSNSDDITSVLFSGTTRAVRFFTNTNGTTLEGVDNTGFTSYQPLTIGGSIVTFTINGSEKMRLTSAGNVGIGTTSPSYKLHVEGTIYGNSSSDVGVRGNSSSSTGVHGSSSTYLGVRGDSTSSYGVYGASTNNHGVVGRTESSGGIGVFGVNGASGTYFYGAYSSYAIYGSGNAYFSGSLSKGSGSFKISHPLPELSETHNLVHSFVEAPTADNIYRGKVQLENGQATVNIDNHVGMTEGTFSALNGNIQVFLQNDSGWDLVRGTVSDNILTIISQNQSSTDTISWMVIGERQDQHMLDTQWTDEFGRPILEPLREPEPDIPLPEVSNENG